MDTFYYEIIGPAGTDSKISDVRRLIESHPQLAEVATPWEKPWRPLQADLYALFVVVGTGLTDDDGLVGKVKHASAGNFPILPIVDDVALHDFKSMELPELAERNAEGLATPERLVRSALHHAGIELFGSGGHVFLSYARADGTSLAEAVRDGLHAARIGQTIDIYEFAGGDLIQDDIERRIAKSDLVIVVDSKGASKSPWVAEEIDIAGAFHVPIIAVTPTQGAFHHMLQVPHVEWGAGVSPEAQVVSAAKRILARKHAFRARVGRILARFVTLRGWSLIECGERWRLLTPSNQPLTVGCTSDLPRVEAVTRLRHEVIPARGVLVAGIRPLQRNTLQGLMAAGGEQVSVATLLTMAARIPVGLSPAPLTGRRIFLSASMPSTLEDVELARTTLVRFVVGLTQALIELGAVLVFGGHPSVTPMVHRALINLVGDGSGHVELHQARFWYNDFKSVAASVREGPVFNQVIWHGQGEDASADVAALRDGMIQTGLDAAVFVGGKTTGFIGPKPGVVDEFERYCALGLSMPAFVVGLAGGAARTLREPQGRIDAALLNTGDPDLAIALIIAELLNV